MGWEIQCRAIVTRVIFSPSALNPLSVIRFPSSVLISLPFYFLALPFAFIVPIFYFGDAVTLLFSPFTGLWNFLFRGSVLTRLIFLPDAYC